jgi:hypothetical protein
MKWPEATMYIILILALFGGCVVCNHYRPSNKNIQPLIEINTKGGVPCHTESVQDAK